MSLTQGRSNPWSTGRKRRRLAAGEARCGGAMRVSCSGDQMGGGDHLRVARSKTRRVRVVVGLGVTENDAGDELCGCRSLGEVETIAGGVARGVRWCYGFLRVR